MPNFDYDPVSGDFEPECECACWECRQGRHSSCTARTACVIARICTDCSREECVCGKPACDNCGEHWPLGKWGRMMICERCREEIEIEKADECGEVHFADDSPMSLDAIGEIVQKMWRLEL